jgi:uncharacterized protein YneF (UPF0154 family)
MEYIIVGSVMAIIVILVGGFFISLEIIKNLKEESKWL